MLWVSKPMLNSGHLELISRLIGKVGMSVLTKGLAMDFVRQGRTGMAITSIWPASVRTSATQINSTY